MTKLESGYKWWIRYVIVPLIGGGGIIAIIVALLTQQAPTTKIGRENKTSPVEISKLVHIYSLRVEGNKATHKEFLEELRALPNV